MSQERIDAVFSSTEKHTGISNIQKRIHMLCGKKYGITYDSSLTEFTIATIKLPVLKENPEHSL